MLFWKGRLTIKPFSWNRTQEGRVRGRHINSLSSKRRILMWCTWSIRIGLRAGSLTSGELEGTGKSPVHLITYKMSAFSKFYFSRSTRTQLIWPRRLRYMRTSCSCTSHYSNTSMECTVVTISFRPNIPIEMPRIWAAIEGELTLLATQPEETVQV